MWFIEKYCRQTSVAQKLRNEAAEAYRRTTDAVFGVDNHADLHITTIKPECEFKPIMNPIKSWHQYGLCSSIRTCNNSSDKSLYYQRKILSIWPMLNIQKHSQNHHQVSDDEADRNIEFLSTTTVHKLSNIRTPPPPHTHTHTTTSIAMNSVIDSMLLHDGRRSEIDRN